MNKVKITLFASVLFASFFLISKSVLASDGETELVSVTNEDYRCYAYSLRTDNVKVLISCVGLIYPSPGPYVLWATPTDGTRTIKLGTLDYGKKYLGSNKDFSSLFVTHEANVGAREPSTNVIMRGDVKPIEFLARPPTPTPTPDEKEAREGETGETDEEKQEKPQSTRDKLMTALKRAGLAAVIVLFVLVGLIFVITRARG